MTVASNLYIVEIPDLTLAANVQSGDKFVFDRNGVTMHTPFEYIQSAVGGRITGEMIMWGASSIPTGWLECNYQAVSRTTYANLFSVIGTTYGVGNGSTTFNLPDMRGRVPVGSGTGVIHPGSSPLTARTLGGYVGAESGTDTDTPTITVNSASVTGSITINPIAYSLNPTGSVTINPIPYSLAPTGTISIDDHDDTLTSNNHDHNVVLPGVEVAEAVGTSVATSGTRTTTQVQVITDLSTQPLTHASTFLGDELSGNFTATGSININTLSGNLTATGAVSINNHSHSASSSEVSITINTVPPATVVKFLIKT
jgi:microcystin-dependent protein